MVLVKHVAACICPWQLLPVCHNGLHQCRCLQVSCCQTGAEAATSLLLQKPCLSLLPGNATGGTFHSLAVLFLKGQPHSWSADLLTASTQRSTRAASTTNVGPAIHLPSLLSWQEAAWWPLAPSRCIRAM